MTELQILITFTKPMTAQTTEDTFEIRDVTLIDAPALRLEREIKKKTFVFLFS